MIGTVEWSSAHLITLEHWSLTTTHRLTAKRWVSHHYGVETLRMTPNIATQYTERKAEYLVLPQMQDFVTKAGHCGHGPGWHKLKERQKVLDNVHRWKWPTCTYGHTLVSDDLQAAEWAFQKKKKSFMRKDVHSTPLLDLINTDYFITVSPKDTFKTILTSFPTSLSHKNSSFINGWTGNVTELFIIMDFSSEKAAFFT